MKKTIFEGIVNGTKYDNVDDYNKAVQAAINEGQNVEASSSTKIIECEDDDCECKKCECKKEIPDIDFNFKSMMKKNPCELEEMLDQLENNFKQLPDHYKESLLHLIKDTRVIAERQMKVTEKDIDNLDTQAAEIQNQIESLDKQYDDIVAMADEREEAYDKLSMVVEALNGIIEDNKDIETEEMTISDLWKKLFNMPDIKKK